MILVAGGDSFIYGSELKDQLLEHSMSTYPALLAKQYNMEYVCAAWSGNANNAISRMVISTCEQLKEKKEKITALVTWTFVNRYEFRFNYNTRQKNSPWYSVNAWSVLDDTDQIEQEFKLKNDLILNLQKKHINTTKQTGIADFAKVFFKHVGNSEYYELYSSLKEILFLQLYFTQNSIPYLFIPADNVFFQHPNFFRQQDVYLETLYKQIDWSKWFFFDVGSKPNETQHPRGFYQWAAENKYQMGTTHPLEEAHTAAAELIKEKFNELVTKPVEQNSTRNKISS
jgi:hypothetical protein